MIEKLAELPNASRADFFTFPNPALGWTSTDQVGVEGGQMAESQNRIFVGAYDKIFLKSELI